MVGGSLVTASQSGVLVPTPAGFQVRIRGGKQDGEVRRKRGPRAVRSDHVHVSIGGKDELMTRGRGGGGGSRRHGRHQQGEESEERFHSTNSGRGLTGAGDGVRQAESRFHAKVGMVDR